MQFIKSGNSRVSPVDKTLNFVKHLDPLLQHEHEHIYRSVSKDTIYEIIDKFPVVDEEGNKFTIWSDVQGFKKFSPGVYLMFKLLKHLIVMFGVIALISIIQFILLLKSPYYQGYPNVVRINLLRITLASLQPQSYTVYVVLDMMIVVVVIGFLVWWNERLAKYAKECNDHNPLPSYLTVQLARIPPDYTEANLMQYLKTVGGVNPHEIYTGRNYGRFLNHYKSLTQSANELRVAKTLFENQQSQCARYLLAKPVIQKFMELKDRYWKIIGEIFNEKKYRPKEVFIVMSNYYQRNKLLHNQPHPLSCLKRKENGNIHYEFKPCQVQPEAIAWENIGISKLNYFTRAFLVLLVLSMVTFLGVMVIFTLQILETAAIGDAYYFHEQNGLRGVQENQECIQSSECKLLEPDYAQLAFLILLTPLVIFVCKKLMMGLLWHFVHFRKFPSEVTRIRSQTIILTFFYFFVVGALHLLLYLRIENQNGYVSIYESLSPLIYEMFKITRYSPVSIHLYSDFSLDWYKQATFLLIIISSISFNITNIFKFLIGVASFKMQKRKALKQTSLYKVTKTLTGLDLHMQHVYASMSVIVLFCLLYGCSFPLTVVFALINLLLLYFTTKWSFIRYVSRPLRMGHSINRLVVNILLLGVIIHCIMAPIFLGAAGIGSNNSHFSYNKEHPNEADELRPPPIADRYHNMGIFYLILAFLISGYIVLRNIRSTQIFSGLQKLILAKFRANNEETDKMSFDQEHFGLYPSYSIHSDSKYEQVVKNVFLLNKVEAKRNTCLSPSMLKNINFDEFSQNTGKQFEEILEISRKYLQKQSQLSKQMQKIALTVDKNSQSGSETQGRFSHSKYLDDDVIDYVMEQQS